MTDEARPSHEDVDMRFVRKEWWTTRNMAAGVAAFAVLMTTSAALSASTVHPVGVVFALVLYGFVGVVLAAVVKAVYQWTVYAIRWTPERRRPE